MKRQLLKTGGRSHGIVVEPHKELSYRLSGIRPIWKTSRTGGDSIERQRSITQLTDLDKAQSNPEETKRNCERAENKVNLQTNPSHQDRLKNRLGAPKSIWKIFTDQDAGTWRTDREETRGWTGNKLTGNRLKNFHQKKEFRRSFREERADIQRNRDEIK